MEPQRINKRVEMRPSPGRGMGVFAVEDVPAGALLIVEKAILRLPYPFDANSEEQLQTLYDQLPKHQQKQFDNLAEGQRPFKTRLMRIYRNNSFASTDGQNPTAYIVLNISRVNHSCIPNATTGELNTQHHTLRAIFPIPKGEEVTISYECGPRELMTAAQRRTVHNALYNFTCKCIACVDTPFGRLSDMRRILMSKLHWTLEYKTVPDYNYVEPGAASRSPAQPLRFPQFLLPPSEWLSSRKKLQYAFLLVKLMEAEGLVNGELVSRYKFLVTSLVDLVSDGINNGDFADIRALARMYVDLRDWRIKLRENAILQYGIKDAGPVIVVASAEDLEKGLEMACRRERSNIDNNWAEIIGLGF